MSPKNSNGAHVDFSICPSIRSEVVFETASNLPWYGVRTKSNCEKVASAILEGKGHACYLPLSRIRRTWSDRVVETELPLFPGYIFCRFDATRRLPIITNPGVVAIIGCGKNPAPVCDSEIEAIRTILRSGRAVEPCQFLHEGEAIRVNRGPLEGLQGILLKNKSE